MLYLVDPPPPRHHQISAFGVWRYLLTVYQQGKISHTQGDSCDTRNLHMHEMKFYMKFVNSIYAFQAKKIILLMFQKTKWW